MAEGEGEAPRLPERRGGTRTGAALEAERCRWHRGPGEGRSAVVTIWGQFWAGPRRSEELLKTRTRSPIAEMGVECAGTRSGPGSMRAGAEVAGPGCASCDRAYREQSVQCGGRATNRWVGAHTDTKRN
jgi:hypothetical protein